MPYVQTSVDADWSSGPALSVSCSELNVPYVQTSVDLTGPLVLLCQCHAVN